MKILQNDLFYKINSIFRKIYVKRGLFERKYWVEIGIWEREHWSMINERMAQKVKLNLKETGKDIQILMREN